MHNSVFVIGIGTRDVARVARMIHKPANGSEFRGNTAYSKVAGDGRPVSGGKRGSRTTIESEGWLAIQAEIEEMYTTLQDDKTNIHMSSRNGNLFEHIDQIKESYPDATIIIIHSQANTARVLDKVALNDNTKAIADLTKLNDTIASYVQGMQPIVVDMNTDTDYILPTGEYVCECEDVNKRTLNIEYYVV